MDDIEHVSTTTSEMMNRCVDGWIKDLAHGCMGLRNIWASSKAHYLTEVQKNAIKEAVLKLQSTLHATLEKCSYIHNT